MPPPGANVAQALRVGPGALRWAPLATARPTDLTAAWAAAWKGLGYTEDGNELENAPSFEQRRVAEELLALATYETERNMRIRVALSQINEQSLMLLFNGGTVSTAAGDGSKIYNPPAAGLFTPVMLGWESDDSPTPLERMVWAKVTQIGSVTVPRRKAPQAANIPLEFEVGVPASGQPFDWILASSLLTAP